LRLAELDEIVKTNGKVFNELVEKKDEFEQDKTEAERKLSNLESQIQQTTLSIDLDVETKRLESFTSSLETDNGKLEKMEEQLTQAEGIVAELIQSQSHLSKYNDIDIEVVYSNYQEEQKKLIEAEKVYSNAKLYLSLAEEKIKHLDKHEYDPNCKYCCDNTFVKDAMVAKNALPELEGIVKQALIDATGIQQTLDRWDDVEEQYNELTDLKIKLGQSKSILKTAEAELKGLETREELLETQLDKVEEDIEKYFENEETIQSNKELEKQIKDLEIAKKRFESDIKDITKQIATTNGSISSLQTYIDSIKQKMNEVKDLEEKNRLYTYYLDAVKRDGIPYELISKALPVIENEVNNILAQVVDFGVTMEMDGKSINAKIVYEDQEWPLEMCSGMEKFVSGLAIRVALINVCNLPRPNFLVVDEGFGTLDADNLSSLFMMMQYLKTQFDFIWVISHLEQMRDIVDGLIEIKKVNGFSKIDF
jgi:exonuclease SbcC